jgi:ribosomal protein S18 acetylase RimI-like enzyme
MAEELGRRIEELAGPDAPHFLGLSKLFDDHHPHGSYWYLQFLGVVPDWQGQGIGSAVLERCDREGVRGLLDATIDRRPPCGWSYLERSGRNRHIPGERHITSTC